MADIIQIRRDTASNWTSADPTLAQGELGYETDTDKVKIGDGTTAWTSLGYVINTGSYLQSSDIGSTVQGYSAVLAATTASFTTADETKLDGIETSATADQTAQEIATAIDADATAEATLKSALGLGTAAYTASTDYVAVTGDTMTGNLNFGDNVKAQFGAGSDLQIYHDGAASYIDEAGTGSLYVRSNGTQVFITDSTSTNHMARFTPSGASTLYYSGATKLATTSTGVSVTGVAVGTLTTDNDLSFDMTASNQFKCTPAANGTLTFTNITAGQSGNIFLVNSGGYAISAAATTYISAADLSAISTAGSYFLSYFSDGTNVMVSASAAVTSAGA